MAAVQTLNGNELQRAAAGLLGVASPSPLPELAAASESRYRSIVETARGGIWIVDTAGVTTFVNNRMAEMLGYTVEQMLGQSVLAFVFDEERAAAREQLDRRRQGLSEQFDFRLRRKDGTELWVIVSTNPLTDAKGEFAGALAMLSDITARRRDEERLRASEQRLSEAERLAKLGHWVWDLATDEATWSAGHYRLFGLEPTALGVIRWAEVVERIHPDDREPVREMVARAASAGTPLEYRARFRLPDGSWGLFESRATPQFDTAGGVVGMMGTLQDVTERDSAAAALRESEARFRESFQRAGIGKGLVAPDGHFLEANAAFCRLTGYSEAELRARTFRDITHPDDRERDCELVAQLLCGQAASYQREKRYLHKNGTVIWIRLSVTLVRAGDGTPRYFLGEVEDVTPRQRAEAMLEENQAHLQALVGSLDDIVFEFDGEGTYVNVWCRDEAMLARPRGELLGRRVGEILGEEEARPFVELFRRVLATGLPETMEYTVDVQGGKRWFLARITTVPTPGGAAQTVCMLPRDITSRKEAEQALREANSQLATALEDLQRAQEQTIRQERLHALGEMASGIAHDFNNALAAVLGFSELLLAEPGVLDDRQRALSYLQLIHAGASDAAGVVRRLREFYRPQEHADGAPIDLVEVAEAAISLTRPRWSNQALASGRIVDVERNLQPLPHVWGDEGALREMLTNLIFNAVDAIPGDGTITVRTHCEGERVVLQVADSGTGMSEAVRRRCLEPFFTTKGDAGSGLGLSMVYGVVSRHRGELAIDSVAGEGTTVTVSLPLAAPSRSSRAAAPVASPPRCLRVLVVDDEPMVREVVGKFLAIDGHQVSKAVSGAEALQLIAATPFEVAIIDRAMPGMTGDQLAAEMSACAPGMGVVLLSGFGDLMLAAGERPPGVDVVIGKPVGIPALREAVGRALARREKRAPS